MTYWACLCVCVSVDGHLGSWPPSWILSLLLKSDSLPLFLPTSLPPSQLCLHRQLGVRWHTDEQTSKKKSRGRKRKRGNEEYQNERRRCVCGGGHSKRPEGTWKLKTRTREQQNAWKERYNSSAVAGKGQALRCEMSGLFNSLGGNDYGAVLNVICWVEPSSAASFWIYILTVWQRLQTF